MPERQKPLSKAEFLQEIANLSGFPRREVVVMYEAMQTVIRRQLSRRGPGVVNLPGLLKIEKKKVPARPARKGVKNPFKPGELMDVSAKPASTKIKVRPLKNLKELS